MFNYDDPDFRNASESRRMLPNEVVPNGQGVFFRPTHHGKYTITFNATIGDRSAAPLIIIISVGDVFPPSITQFGGVAFTGVSPHGLTYNQGDNFQFRTVTARGRDFEVADPNADNAYKNPEDFTFRKEIFIDGELISEWTVSGVGLLFANRTMNTGLDNMILDRTGRYEVRYTVIDQHGNETDARFTFQVQGNIGRDPFSLTVLSVVLTIVGVLLIVVLVVYLIKFRKIKE